MVVGTGWGEWSQLWGTGSASVLPWGGCPRCFSFYPGVAANQRRPPTFWVSTPQIVTEVVYETTRFLIREPTPSSSTTALGFDLSVLANVRDARIMNPPLEAAI